MMTDSLNLTHRLAFFITIGGAAALINIFIVLALVSALEIQPLHANILGFLIAFNVSFFGHKYLTFSELHDQKQLSLPHFFMVAVSSGMMNEALYFLFLRFTHLNYIVALILVLGLISIYTFMLSRFWACR